MKEAINKIHVTENGFSMDGSGKVAIPECYIEASSYLEAVKILDEFLKTKIKSDKIELITPIEKIAFK